MIKHYVAPLKNVESSPTFCDNKPVALVCHKVKLIDHHCPVVMESEQRSMVLPTKLAGGTRDFLRGEEAWRSLEKLLQVSPGDSGMLSPRALPGDIPFLRCERSLFSSLSIYVVGWRSRCGDDDNAFCAVGLRGESEKKRRQKISNKVCRKNVEQVSLGFDTG
ncbi:hypothetical protein KM043_002407 [Ampulex compressa]|nr:hypothetical protein KM043_002407 [Ampulex compressa]